MAMISKTCVSVKFQLVMMFVLFVSPGLCLQCYKCFGNDRHCSNGDTQYMSILNCSRNEVCAKFKYKMDDSTASYVTTVRGCQLTVKEGICKQIMTTKSTKAGVQTGVLCETCETDLCNSSPTRSLSLSALLIVTFMVILNV